MLLCRRLVYYSNHCLKCSNIRQTHLVVDGFGQKIFHFSDFFFWTEVIMSWNQKLVLRHKCRVTELIFLNGITILLLFRFYGWIFLKITTGAIWLLLLRDRIRRLCLFSLRRKAWSFCPGNCSLTRLFFFEFIKSRHIFRKEEGQNAALHLLLMLYLNVIFTDNKA